MSDPCDAYCDYCDDIIHSRAACPHVAVAREYRFRIAAARYTAARELELERFAVFGPFRPSHPTHAGIGEDWSGFFTRDIYRFMD